MSFTYENQGTHTYLAYAVGQDDVIDTMSLGMLTNNKIPGLAQALFTQIDTVKYVKYDVSAKVSAAQFFAGAVSKKRLLGVFSGVVDAFLAAEDYMIDGNSLLLDLDYIFADVSTCETVMICLPIVSDDLANKDMKEFFRNIMFSTQFDQTENCDYVAKIINYLNSTPAFSPEEFKKVLDSVKQTNVVVAQQPVVQPKAVQSVAPQSAPAQPKVAQPVAPQNVAPQPKVPQPPVKQPPVSKPAVQVPASPEKKAEEPQEKMSWFYLMQHYNKENAAIYKAQQEAAKGKKTTAAAAPAKPAPAPKMATPGGFAVPGQPTPPPVNQGFAVPGQSAPVQPKAPQPAAPMAPQPAAPKAAKPLPNPMYAAAQTPQGQAMNFGDTTILDNNVYDGTTVLGAEPVAQVKPYLIRSKNSDRIVLDQDLFRIGAERSYANYYIGDNPAISRSHANIVCRNGEYYIVDTNSTNHTYVNGEMIQSNQEVKLVHGTKLRLANEEFEFRSY